VRSRRSPSPSLPTEPHWPPPVISSRRPHCWTTVCAPPPTRLGGAWRLVHHLPVTAVVAQQSGHHDYADELLTELDDLVPRRDGRAHAIQDRYGTPCPHQQSPGGLSSRQTPAPRELQILHRQHGSQICGGSPGTYTYRPTRSPLRSPCNASTRGPRPDKGSRQHREDRPPTTAPAGVGPTHQIDQQPNG
jgi:hypothetical protein